jgi:hypothetical protein
MTDDWVPDWIFGYGSLIDVASRTLTDPLIGPARPAIVEGLRRGLVGARRTDAGYDVCRGGAGRARHLRRRDLREGRRNRRANHGEHKYVFAKLDPAAITALDGGSIDLDVTYGYYRQRDPHEPPDEQAPITLSSVDIVMSGCLLVEQIFPLAAKARFMAHFVKSTSDWSTHWVNDRAYPRRPMSDQPATPAIDTCLAELLPTEFAGFASNDRCATGRPHRDSPRIVTGYAGYSSRQRLLSRLPKPVRRGGCRMLSIAGNGVSGERSEIWR